MEKGSSHWCQPVGRKEVRATTASMASSRGVFFVWILGFEAVFLLDLFQKSGRSYTSPVMPGTVGIRKPTISFFFIVIGFCFIIESRWLGRTFLGRSSWISLLPFLVIFTCFWVPKELHITRIARDGGDVNPTLAPFLVIFTCLSDPKGNDGEDPHMRVLQWGSSWNTGPAS